VTGLTKAPDTKLVSQRWTLSQERKRELVHPVWVHFKDPSDTKVVPIHGAQKREMRNRTETDPFQAKSVVTVNLTDTKISWMIWLSFSDSQGILPWQPIFGQNL